MRIRQADDLARVAGIGENFLIAGETGIENDFAATAAASARRASVKDSPVFEREYRANFGVLLQGDFLQIASCYEIFHFDAAFTVDVDVGDSEPKCSTGQYANTALPYMNLRGTGPKTRESLELSRWSPITKYSPGGIFRAG